MRMNGVSHGAGATDNDRTALVGHLTLNHHHRRLITEFKVYLLGAGRQGRNTYNHVYKLFHLLIF